MPCRSAAASRRAARPNGCAIRRRLRGLLHRVRKARVQRDKVASRANRHRTCSCSRRLEHFVGECVVLAGQECGRQAAVAAVACG